MKDIYLDFIQKSVSSMSEEEDLKEYFELNSKEAKKLSELVKKYQVHFGDNCDKCKNPSLPSLIGMFKSLPGTRAMHNIYESRELCKVLLEILTLCVYGSLCNKFRIKFKQYVLLHNTSRGR